MKSSLSFSSVFRLFALLCAAMLLQSPLARAAGAKPQIYAFNVSGSTTMNLGETKTFNWSVGNATTVTLTPGVGVVTGDEVTVTPTTTTTYVLTATNANGSVTASKKITVIVPPVFQSIAAAPDTIAAGASTTLSWSAPGTSYFAVVTDRGDDLGNVFANSLVVKPSQTTTYTVTAHNTAGTDTRTVTVTVNAPLPKPAIASFKATPNSIVAGNAATLSWSVTGATSLSISPGIGAVTGSSVSVTPTATTTYTLTATNASGSVTRNVTVTVTAPPTPPVIAAFTATPDSIHAGETSTLAWSVTGANALSISASAGPSPGIVTGTSLAVTPTTSTTYTLSATNSGGTVTRAVAVAVATVVPAPVIASFTATPQTVTQGQPVTLNWSVTGADALSLSPGIGAVTGNSFTFTPQVSGTYVLVATSAGGAVAKALDVTVITPVAPPTITSFTSVPGTIAAGGSATLSWTVNNADSLSISSSVGAAPGAVTGTSVNVSPTAGTVYTLTATNAGGSVTKTTAVNVTNPLPVVHSFGSIPSTINAGESTTLFWDVTGAVSISIAADHGPSPGAVTGTTLTVAPDVTLLYTLTATNASGGTTISVAQVTVNAAPPLPVPVIGSFAASPDTISIGSSTTLNWSVTGADSISIAANKGPSPGVVTGTSLAVNPTENTTYTLSATNSFGTVTRTAAVTVTGPTAPVIGFFDATPAFIPNGSSSTLSWSVSGADSLAIAADVGASPGAVTGTSLVVTPAATTTYTLTATNAIGQTTAIVPVTIFTSTPGTVSHPRIWVTPSLATTLNNRAAANDAAWLKLRADADAFVSMPIQFPDEDQRSGTINGGYQYNDYLLPSETLALAYVATKVADPVRAARYAAKERQLLLVLSDPVHHGRPTTDSGYSIRSYVPALALGYDWIYETLSDADRAQVYTEINRWVASFDTQGFGRNFPQGNYFAGYYCAKALGALATEGENPNAATMWNDWLNRIHYGMVQPYHQQWLSGGGAPDGWNYGPFELINMIRPIAAALTAKGLDLIHDAKPMAYFDGHARWMTQFTWPDMKTVSDRGFVYEGDIPSPLGADWATQFNGLLHLAGGDNAALMQKFTLDARGSVGTGDVDAWVEFLFHNPNAPTAEYRTQLSYRTNGDGQVAMRSAWTPNAVWATFQSGPLTNFPDSAEELFDQGSLAIQRGNVQFLVNPWGAMMRHTPGTDDGNGVFDFVYNELFGTQTDGVASGRRIFNLFYAARQNSYWGQVGNGPGDAHTTLARFEDGGSFVFMRGTRLEEQYADDHPIASWTRNLAYVRPQLFVVYDRTTLKTASVDNWMAWHVAGAPADQSGATPGTHRFDVVDTRAAFGGNLFRGRVSTVLPAGNQTRIVDLDNRHKVYRIEVRPSSPIATSAWLTVFDASASATAAKNAAPLTGSANGVIAADGTLISGGDGSSVAVLFSKSGAAINGALNVTLPVADTYCLVTDVVPGAGYAINVDNSSGQLVVMVAPGGAFTASAQGSLAFNVSAAGAVSQP